MPEPNLGKLAFSRYWTYLEGEFITSDICHNYGIMSGCDEECPALLDGNCENIKDAIESCDITNNKQQTTNKERKEILSLYINVI
jgi:hypothetical protein